MKLKFKKNEIKEILKKEGINQNQFAKEIKIDPKSLNKAIKGIPVSLRIGNAIKDNLINRGIKLNKFLEPSNNIKENIVDFGTVDSSCKDIPEFNNSENYLEYYLNSYSVPKLKEFPYTIQPKKLKSIEELKENLSDFKFGSSIFSIDENTNLNSELKLDIEFSAKLLLEPPKKIKPSGNISSVINQLSGKEKFFELHEKLFKDIQINYFHWKKYVPFLENLNKEDPYYEGPEAYTFNFRLCDILGIHYGDIKKDYLFQIDHNLSIFPAQLNEKIRDVLWRKSKIECFRINGMKTFCLEEIINSALHDTFDFPIVGHDFPKDKFIKYLNSLKINYNAQL